MKRIFLILSTIFFIGCEVEPTMYTLNVSSNPTEGGTINPTTGVYEEGTEITINVTPNTNYEFDKWSGSWSGSESPLTITMDGDKNLIGNFILMDSDGDGVTDDLDTCPDTPEGEVVDENGCSDSQKVTYIVLGYSNDDDSLYEIDLEDGSLTSSHNPSEDLYWDLEYLPSKNKIVSTTDGGSGLLILDLETGESNIVTYGNKGIERLVVIKDDIVLGYSNDDDSLYEIDLEDGSLTSSHNPSEDLYWDLEYLPSKNKIVSTTDGGSGLLILDLETGESNIVTYGNKGIERLVVIKDDIVLGYSNDDDSLYEIDLEDGSLTSSHNPSEDLYWDLEYLPSKNKIVSTTDGGSGLLILDLETGESNIVTYGNKGIERLVVIKD
jgi:hypothetical protein